jgi:hypothetical protein
VDVLETSKELVHEKLLVLSCDVVIDPYNVVKIGFHVITDHIDLIEPVFVAWHHNFMDSQYLK